MDTNEALTPLSTAGSASILCYYSVGPSQQLGGYGFGQDYLVVLTLGPATTTLQTALTDTTGTTIVLNSSSAFPASGTIQIDSEFITYTNNTTLQIL